MQAPYRSPPNARFNSHHGGKRQLLGNPAANIAPAWKVNAQAKEKQKLQEGSKILLSGLPVDVGDTEVEVSARTGWLWQGRHAHIFYV
jgi:THO complex subunit 4